MIKNSWLFDSAIENIGLKEAISTVLQEIEHLQKENEKLISYKTTLLMEDLAEANRLYDEENKRCMMFAIENNDLKEKLSNSISKDKIREKIELLEADNEQDTESVKRYEEMRRNTQDSFYKKSYQTSIHELNTKRGMRKMFINILQDLQKEE